MEPTLSVSTGKGTTLRGFLCGQGGESNVRFGSLADITAPSRHVRFTPTADIVSARGMSEKCH